MRVTNKTLDMPLATGIIALLAAFLLSNPISAEVHGRTDSSEEFLNAWLAQQSQVKTWSADVVQIRKLKSLVRPLKSRGQVWFKQPNQFRWQLGDPPRTIAVRKEEELLMLERRF